MQNGMKWMSRRLEGLSKSIALEDKDCCLVPWIKRLLGFTLPPSRLGI